MNTRDTEAKTLESRLLTSALDRLDNSTHAMQETVSGLRADVAQMNSRLGSLEETLARASQAYDLATTLRVQLDEVRDKVADMSLLKEEVRQQKWIVRGAIAVLTAGAGLIPILATVYSYFSR